MIPVNRRAFLAGCVILTLSGCALMAAGRQGAAPPPPEAALQSRPRPTPTTPPSELPPDESGQGGGGAGTAASGEILFVRAGQIWAIRPDGSGERALTPTPSDSVIKDLVLSPSGRYLAFTLNLQEVAVLDLRVGQLTTVDSIEQGSVGSLVWKPDSSALYYHRLTTDAEGAPVGSAVFLTAVPVAGAPTPVRQSDLTAGEPVVLPGFALADALLVHQIAAPGEAPGQWLTLDMVSGAALPVEDGFGLWDVAPAGDRLLMVDLDAAAPGPAAPVPLTVAGFSPASGALNPVQLSPIGESAVYTAARFAPDGRVILALRRDVAQEGQLAQVARLAPNDSGSYIPALIPNPEGTEAVAFAWYSESLTVVQAIPLAGGDPELWLLSMDPGTPALRLGVGEFPVVVP